jgi:hypothetical protein
MFALVAFSRAEWRPPPDDVPPPSGPVELPPAEPGQPPQPPDEMPPGPDEFSQPPPSEEPQRSHSVRSQRDVNT